MMWIRNDTTNAFRSRFNLDPLGNDIGTQNHIEHVIGLWPEIMTELQLECKTTLNSKRTWNRINDALRNVIGTEPKRNP